MGVTAEQKSAIEARGKVMVSASAGAGKTTVMIQRLADILQNSRADLDNVLCVTFTKKAAAQMKDKLRDELIKRLAFCSDKDREWLKKQLNKINSADISTIDSFCMRLVRTYFYALNIDSSFEILASEADVAELKTRAMDNVFERLYEEKNQSFYLLLDEMKKKHNDSALRRLLSAAYDKMRVCPDYDKILEREYNEVFTPEGFKAVCDGVKGLVVRKCTALIESIDRFEVYFRTLKDDDRYFAVLEDIKDTLRGFVKYGDIFDMPTPLTKLKKPSGKSEADDVFSDFRKKLTNKYGAIIKLDGRDNEYLRFIKSGETAKAFIELLRQFDAEYAEVKRVEGKLDYGDLEQFSLRLLKDGDSDIKNAVNQKYEYVFVDEYQDVNPIQDSIISLVGNGDLFCVGDVKQAIYGFRGSRSRFFAEKSDGVKKDGKYIVLPDNFRSSEKVINFVNTLFEQVMKKPLTDVDYTQGHAMRQGGKYPQSHNGVARFCFYDGAKGDKVVADKVYTISDDKVKVKKFSPEAEAVLKLVKEALQTDYFIPPKDPDIPISDCIKKVQPGDICVLTRKRSNKSAQEIVRALSSEYPVVATAEVNVCERAEIIRLLDILSYLNNCEQDVPLASSLLSPLGKLNEGELAKIRIFGGKGQTFRQCVRAYAQQNDDGIAQKLNAFFKEVDRLRTLSGSIGASKLIDEIISSGDFSAEFSSECRQLYLKAFKREAFSSTGELSLNSFLLKIKASGNKINAPSSVASDSINVMTMHASKGLEFPVVIVADLAKFFKGDTTYSLPFDDELGFAPRYYGPDRAYKDTILGKLCSIKQSCEELANEINLFYVACTRAKYALYLLVGEKTEYSPEGAMSARNYSALVDFDNLELESVDMELGSAKTADGTAQTSPDSERDGASDTNTDENSPDLSDDNVNIPDFSSYDEDTLNKIREISSYKYGYELGIQLPVKSSASKLLTERDSIEDAVPLFDEEMEKGADTSPESGIAYHRFLELCDFTVKDKKGVEEELSRFIMQGLITQTQADMLDLDNLVKILAMPVFERVVDKSLYREREFLCKLPSADYVNLREGVHTGISVGEDDGNGVIVQGAIDLLCVRRENGRAVSADIIDYKYTAHSDEYLLKKYSPQLGLYKSVVCRIYGLERDAVTTTLVNVRACRQIDLKV